MLCTPWEISPIWLNNPSGTNKRSASWSQLQVCHAVKASNYRLCPLSTLPDQILFSPGVLLMMALVLLLAYLAAVTCLEIWSKEVSRKAEDVLPAWPVSYLKKPTSLHLWHFFRWSAWRGAWHSQQLRLLVRAWLPASPACPTACCWSSGLAPSSWSPGASWGHLNCFCPSSVKYFQRISPS